MLGLRIPFVRVYWLWILHKPNYDHRTRFVAIVSFFHISSMPLYLLYAIMPLFFASFLCFSSYLCTYLMLVHVSLPYSTCLLYLRAAQISTCMHSICHIFRFMYEYVYIVYAYSFSFLLLFFSPFLACIRGALKT